MSQLDIRDANYELKKLSQLEPWDENPRTISEDEFKRLKDHIERLGVYKPLLINQSNIILGGNMRYKALLELGKEEAMCAVVLTDNKAQMIEYALSDNEQMGTTDETKLAELVTLNPIKTELFAIQTGKLKTIDQVLEQAGPSDKPETVLQCPECGHENTPSAFKPMP